jgi:hypothetical protein
MKDLKEVMINLNKCLDDYNELPLFEVNGLSEILKSLGVNLGWLCQLRNNYYREFQGQYFASNKSSDAAKRRDAELSVPELDEIRKILRHFGELQKDIRSQISLHKNN